MSEWEYRKIDLSQQGPRSDELDLLNAAGADGWELVGITSNNIAHLKRPLDQHAAPPTAYTGTAAPFEGHANGREKDESPHGVKVKYRDAQTNDTWTGRGRMATWLKRKQDAGEDIDDYLV